MGTKSKIKTQLRLRGFEPHHGAWRDFFKFEGVAQKAGKLYRFRQNEHEFSGGEKRWTVDVSCELKDFDRWANSTDRHAVPLDVWAAENGINNIQGVTV